VKTWYLELSEQQSHKFYEIKLEGCLVIIRYGRIGDAGQSSEKTFNSDEKALAEVEKKLKEKRKSGYADAILGEREKKAVNQKPTFAKLSFVGFLPEEYHQTPQTKFGGKPDWLDTPCFPLWHDDSPMMFIGQIVLEQAIFAGLQGKIAYLFGAQDMGSSSAIVLQPGNRVLQSSHEFQAEPARAVAEAELWTVSEQAWCPQIEWGQDFALPEAESDDFERMNDLMGDKIGGSPFIDLELFPENGQADYHVLLQLDGMETQYQRPFEMDFADAGVRIWFLSKDGTAFFYHELSQ
jgi:predicted DNA-binding WGR domain protein